MFYNVRQCSTSIYLPLPLPNSLPSVSKCSEMFDIVRNCPTIYSLPPSFLLHQSVIVRKCSKMFENVRKCSEMFENVRKCLELFNYLCNQGFSMTHSTAAASDDDKDKTLLKYYETKKVSLLPSSKTEVGNRAMKEDVKTIFLNCFEHFRTFSNNIWLMR